MRERNIEQYLRERVKAAGGRAYKFTSPGNDGVPDRLCVFPGGQIIFVELKTPGKAPTPLQLLQHRRLVDLGCQVFVINSHEGVDWLMRQFGGVQQ